MSHRHTVPSPECGVPELAEAGVRSGDVRKLGASGRRTEEHRMPAPGTSLTSGDSQAAFQTFLLRGEKFRGFPVLPSASYQILIKFLLCFTTIYLKSNCLNVCSCPFSENDKWLFSEAILRQLQTHYTLNNCQQLSKYDHGTETHSSTSLFLCSNIFLFQIDDSHILLWECDISIWSVRRWPQAHKTPHSWSEILLSSPSSLELSTNIGDFSQCPENAPTRASLLKAPTSAFQ